MIYDERSKYGLTRIIKESPDPVAKTIALNEMMDLLANQRRQQGVQAQVPLNCASDGTNETTVY